MSEAVVYFIDYAYITNKNGMLKHIKIRKTITVFGIVIYKKYTG